VTRRNSAGRFATKRTPPEDLEFRCPDCPYCLTETGTDGDSFVCYECEASWSMDGRRGRWSDPDELACPSAIKPFDRDGLSPEHESIRHVVERCLLADDHGGKHKAADYYQTWDDDDPRITKETK